MTRSSTEKPKVETAVSLVTLLFFMTLSPGYQATLCAHLALVLRSLAASMPTRFFGADARRRAHQKLVIFCLSRRFPSEQCAQNRAGESQRNADYPRILERENRRRLNQMSR